MNPDYSDDVEYEDQDMAEIKRDVRGLTKRDLLRLSKKSLLQDVRPLHMSQRSLRLSKRSPTLDQPMVIRLSKRQIGQLLQIKRGSLSRFVTIFSKSNDICCQHVTSGCPRDLPTDLARSVLCVSVCPCVRVHPQSTGNDQ